MVGRQPWIGVASAKASHLKGNGYCFTNSFPPVVARRTVKDAGALISAVRWNSDLGSRW